MVSHNSSLLVASRTTADASLVISSSVGVFLIETGSVHLTFFQSSRSSLISIFPPLSLEVAAGIEGEGIKLNHDTYMALFGSFHQIALWFTPLLLALTFRLINMRWNHELVLPIYFLVIPVLFYIAIAIIRVDFPTLRDAGWVFGESATSSRGARCRAETGEVAARTAIDIVFSCSSFVDVGTVSKPWYTFYTLFSWKLTNWEAFWACFPVG